MKETRGDGSEVYFVQKKDKTIFGNYKWYTQYEYIYDLGYRLDFASKEKAEAWIYNKKKQSLQEVVVSTEVV